MAYTELIKNFERIRGYMREFYVYGFKSREEYSRKSGRSYDNERRRIESWMDGYMGFHQSADGKRVFLSIDSRAERHNPLYKALKSKSFTDGDITLHFMLLDILRRAAQQDQGTAGGWRSQQEMMDQMDAEYLSCFLQPMVFDVSTIRLKLKEYGELGLLERKKDGKRMLYRLAPSCSLTGWDDALNFFSEVALCGGVGSFLLDRQQDRSAVGRWGGRQDGIFRFKHHDITQALDSEILCQLLMAISEKRVVALKDEGKWGGRDKTEKVVPLKIFISVRNGRRYLVGYNAARRRFMSFRLDYITKVQVEETVQDFDQLRERLQGIEPHLWGVSLGNGRRMEHVEFTIYIGEDEGYILQRLLREKRCGEVEQIGPHLWRFTAEVYDTSEVVPWMRTFLCRIVSTRCSNRTVENQFWQDVEQMYRLYDLEPTEKRPTGTGARDAAASSAARPAAMDAGNAAAGDAARRTSRSRMIGGGQDDLS